MILTRLGMTPANFLDVKGWPAETQNSLAELGVQLNEGGGGGGGGVVFGKIPSRLAALDDRVSASVCTVSLHGAACRVLVNQQFQEMFCTAQELSQRMQVGHPPHPPTFLIHPPTHPPTHPPIQLESVAPPLMYAAYIAPEDRLDFLEAMAKYLFGKSKDVVRKSLPPTHLFLSLLIHPPTHLFPSSFEPPHSPLPNPPTHPPTPPTQKELSQIVKMRDAQDTVFLAVIRLRILTLAGGAYLATMMTVSPAPSSKYIRGGNREGNPPTHPPKPT